MSEFGEWLMIRWCPHELFTNTKSDLGQCNKEHEALLQMRYHAIPYHTYHIIYITYYHRLIMAACCLCVCVC
jgi:hypothetical protein